MRCEDGDFGTPRLETYGGVDDETLCAADAQVWVYEDDALLSGFCGRHGGGMVIYI